MMSICHLQPLRLPGVSRLICRAGRKVRRTLTASCQRALDLAWPTYAQNPPPGELCRLFVGPSAEPSRACEAYLPAVAEHYCEHRFDLLGSGWVQVRHGMQCRGLEGHRCHAAAPVRPDPDGLWLAGVVNASNLAESQRIWRLVDADYRAIDWHLDFKSGYRWSASTWHGDIRFGQQPGVDVKVPWELARMQHLPQLACAAILAASGAAGFRTPQAYACEFRNEVLDFIATNPPRYGVNWQSSMDVAIRAVNWIAAFDLFRSANFAFDEEFQAVLSKSLYEHGRHIVGHLERHGEVRGNHYLANIAGLMFVAAGLPSTAVTDSWLAFAVEELIAEVRFQFHDDGSNVEASTSYHRLSAEMAVFATALGLGLPAERQAACQSAGIRLYPLPGSNRQTPFAPWYFERLERMAEFTIHVTKPNGRIHQVGDNDSGRFFKFLPSYHCQTVGDAKRRYANLAGYADLPDEADCWIEDPLDHRSLVAAINGLFGRADFAAFARGHRLETELIRTLSGDTRARSYLSGGQVFAALATQVGDETDWPAMQSRLQACPTNVCNELVIPRPASPEPLLYVAYPDFGLFIFRSSRFYLAVRCGRLKEAVQGAHAHYDQLAVELNIDGRDVIADPGTYLYTPDARWRNAYRSAAAHFVPQSRDGREPGRRGEVVFRLSDIARAECLQFGSGSFVGRHVGFGPPVYRVVEVRPQSVRIRDYAEGPLVLKALEPVGESFCGGSPVTASEAYGVRLLCT
jgi:hypothetical protein